MTERDETTQDLTPDRTQDRTQDRLPDRVARSGARGGVPGGAPGRVPDDETDMFAPGRARIIPAAAAAVTVAAGLGARSALAGDVAKYAGDTLYTMLLFWLVLLVAPRTRPVRAAAVAFGVSAAIELFQLTGVPADLALRSELARLVLGTTFNTPDLFWYLVGAAVVGTLWWGVTRDREV